MLLAHAHGVLHLPAAPSLMAKRSYYCTTRMKRDDLRRPTVRAVMARPHQDVAPPPPARKMVTAAPPPARETTTKTVTTTYHDSWFDKLAIGYLSRNLQEASGMKNGKDGYEGLIEAALTISGLFRVDQQWQTVATALERAFPSYI
ncbi:unnamed protein product, partial [Urochloa humidicola]